MDTETCGFINFWLCIAEAAWEDLPSSAAQFAFLLRNKPPSVNADLYRAMGYRLNAQNEIIFFKSFLRGVILEI
jgi:hypothetical protein